MSVMGSSLETAAVQAIQAQQVASKARDREKSQSPSGRRFNDLVDLRAGAVETADAVKKLPQNNSEEADREHERQAGGRPDGSATSSAHIDVQA